MTPEFLEYMAKNKILTHQYQAYVHGQNGTVPESWYSYLTQFELKCEEDYKTYVKLRERYGHLDFNT